MLTRDPIKRKHLRTAIEAQQRLSSLAEFQTMNNPSSPLAFKSKAEQDKTFGDVADVIERYLPDAAPTS